MKDEFPDIDFSKSFEYNTSALKKWMVKNGTHTEEEAEKYINERIEIITAELKEKRDIKSNDYV